MADTTASTQAGNFQPPVAATEGDDGFVAPEAASTNAESRTISVASSAVDIRSQISGVLDGVARAVKFNRGNFTKSAVQTCRSNWDEFNWIMCHPAHSYIWMGERGTDWEHWHYELNTKGPGTIGYEVYWAREGVFSLNGDGGFINWAYIGHVQKLDGGSTLYVTP
ncbi:hypothetical protein NMY22_g13903 [Coprinellus aureogranulatus]|nr:hypothetical protein NMY22_g13903 [Coprinellus aureogranulatus]